MDHVDDGKGEPNFKICAWRINDSKHDLTLDEFIEVCKDMLSFNIPCSQLPQSNHPAI